MSPDESTEPKNPTSPLDRPAAGRPLPASRETEGVINRTEDSLERGLDRIWAQFTRRPYVGALLAAGVGLTVATVFGAAELALAAGVGYAAYQVFKRHVPPGQAIKEALALEKELAG